ncbi:MAG TPA: thiamine-phosphate kinase [Xanthobacteraceae bacterium]|nr:thiamine-phosphate kinase [Xanthobacteraceae bacterium]
MAGGQATQMSGEDRLIARYFKPLARHPGAFALEDDAAVLKIPTGHEVVLKADAIVEGIHFFPDDPADTVARKALRVNLSDLAAKGAKPAGFLLSIALPKRIGKSWLAAFARGLATDARRYRCPLMGGDTDRTHGPITVSVAAFGTLPAGRMVCRRGAKVGDVIVVSGTIGDATLGLRMRQAPSTARRWRLTKSMRQHLLARYLLPQPRNALATALRAHASAAMDISDGLVGDLAKLCRTSGIGADIDADRVPLSAAARQALSLDPILMEPILTGGDDYEIVATVAPRELATLQGKARAAGVALTEIGKVVKERRVRVFGPDGKPMTFKRAAFSHF